MQWLHSPKKLHCRSFGVHYANRHTLPKVFEPSIVTMLRLDTVLLPALHLARRGHCIAPGSSNANVQGAPDLSTCHYVTSHITCHTAIGKLGKKKIYISTTDMSIIFFTLLWWCILTPIYFTNLFFEWDRLKSSIPPASSECKATCFQGGAHISRFSGMPQQPFTRSSPHFQRASYIANINPLWCQNYLALSCLFDDSVPNMHFCSVAVWKTLKSLHDKLPKSSTHPFAVMLASLDSSTMDEE